jgi:hypothetical protein
VKQLLTKHLCDAKLSATAEDAALFGGSASSPVAQAALYDVSPTDLNPQNWTVQNWSFPR